MKWQTWQKWPKITESDRDIVLHQLKWKVLSTFHYLKKVMYGMFLRGSLLIFYFNFFFLHKKTLYCLFIGKEKQISLTYISNKMTKIETDIFSNHDKNVHFLIHDLLKDSLLQCYYATRVFATVLTWLSNRPVISYINQQSYCFLLHKLATLRFSLTWINITTVVSYINKQHYGSLLHDLATLLLSLTWISNPTVFSYLN